MPLCARRVYFFITFSATHDGRPSPVTQVIGIIVILLCTEMVLAACLKEFCFHRSISPKWQQVRLAVCAVCLYALFGALTAWQWQKLPAKSAIISLVRFLLSSTGVIFVEVAVWVSHASSAGAELTVAIGHLLQRSLVCPCVCACVCSGACTLSRAAAVRAWRWTTAS